MKILAVDDDPVFGAILETVLRYHGFSDVTVVDSGPKALKLVQSAHPKFDCIFVDIKMPEMDGIELTGILRAIDPSRRTQIVMVTAMSERQHIDRAFLAGADDYISKPLDEMEFKVRLASIARIEAERQRNLAMQQALTSANQRQHLIEFEDALTLPDRAGTIPYAALRNHFKTISRLRHPMRQGIGISVENAANIFVRTTDAEFAAAMASVAEEILETFKGAETLLAYAGAGDFIFMTGPAVLPSPEAFEAQINTALQGKADLFSPDCLPVVHVGKVAGTSFFSRRSLDEIIETALQSARSRSSGPATLTEKTG